MTMEEQTQNTECFICLEPLEPSSRETWEISCTPRCSKNYHASCLSKWWPQEADDFKEANLTIDYHPRCPLCRQDISHFTTYIDENCVCRYNIRNCTLQKFIFTDPYIKEISADGFMADVDNRRNPSGKKVTVRLKRYLENRSPTMLVPIESYPLILLTEFERRKYYPEVSETPERHSHHSPEAQLDIESPADAQTGSEVQPEVVIRFSIFEPSIVVAGDSEDGPYDSDDLDIFRCC
jgi:hypothetical protein